MAGIRKRLNDIYEFQVAKQNLVNWLSFRLDYPLMKPRDVTFLVTHGCNLHCQMCACGVAGPNPEGGGYIVAKRDEIGLDVWKKTVDELEKWGIRNLILSGGEILLRKQDCLDLVSYASRKGFLTTVVTNALGWDEELCEQFASRGLTNFTTSIDGAKPETHDKIRGRGGSYAKVIRCLEKFKNLRVIYPSISTNTTTVVQRENYMELEDLYSILSNLGVTCIMYQAISGDYPQYMIPREEMADFVQVIEKLIKIKRSGGPIHNSVEYFETMPRYYGEKLANDGRFKIGDCLAAYNGLIISPNGGVDICGFGPFGVSVKDMDVRDLWRSKAFREARKKVAGCEKQCLYLCYPKVSYKHLTSEITNVIASSSREALKNLGSGLKKRN